MSKALPWWAEGDVNVHFATLEEISICTCSKTALSLESCGDNRYGAFALKAYMLRPFNNG